MRSSVGKVIQISILKIFLPAFMKDTGYRLNSDTIKGELTFRV